MTSDVPPGLPVLLQQEECCDGVHLVSDEYGIPPNAMAAVTTSPASSTHRTRNITSGEARGLGELPQRTIPWGYKRYDLQRPAYASSFLSRL